MKLYNKNLRDYTTYFIIFTIILLFLNVIYVFLTLLEIIHLIIINRNYDKYVNT